MPNYISAITLPNAAFYDIRDKSAQHYIGITTSSLTTGDTTNPITIGGNSVTAKANDLVLTSSGNEQFLFNGTFWQSLTAVTEIPSDATITIQRNSDATTNQAFTLNQNSNATINIPIPVEEVQVAGTSVMPVSGTTININAIPADIITAGTGLDANVKMEAGYTPSAPDSMDIATAKYVNEQIAAIPGPMIFKDGVKLTADRTDTTKCSITKDDGTSLGTIKIGYTYKVIEIASSPEYTGTLKVGDTFVAKKAYPKTDATWVANIDWVTIPSGDEPSGTVTSIAVGAGLGTSEALDGAITDIGTISLKLKSQSDAFAGAAANVDTTATTKIYPVALDSNGKLAVAVPWVNDNLPIFDSNSDPYNATTNKAATVDTVNDAIAALDYNINETVNDANKTIDVLKQVDGTISATYKNISIPISQVNNVIATTTIKNPTKATVALSVDAAAPGATAPSNSLIYYSYDSNTETLSLYQLGYTTGDSISTTDVANVITKTTS